MDFFRKWKGHSWDNPLDIDFEQSKQRSLWKLIICRKKIAKEGEIRISFCFKDSGNCQRKHRSPIVVVWNRHSLYQQGNCLSRPSFTFQRRAAASLISKDLPSRWKFPPNWNDRSFLASNHSISYSWQNQQ